MNRVRAIFLLITGLSSAGAFGQGNKSGVSQFEKNLQNGEIQLLDVRTAAEYQAGHIPHSLQANWKNREEFSVRTAFLEKNKPVYVYCASGVRSAAAAGWLRENGFKQVVELDGGFNAWKQKNKPVTVSPAITQKSWSDYAAGIHQHEKVLVVFCSDFLPACAKQTPVLRQLPATVKGKFAVLQLDAGSYEKVMQQLKVTGKPTYIMYNKGKETWRKQGVVSAKELKGVIGEVGKAPIP